MDIGFFPMQTRGNYTIFINRKAGNYCRVVVINNLMQFHYFQQFCWPLMEIKLLLNDCLN